MRLAWILAGIGLVATSGCFEEAAPMTDDGEVTGDASTTSGACDPGSLQCACFPNGTCNVSLVCTQGLCGPDDDGTTTSMPPGTEDTTGTGTGTTEDTTSTSSDSGSTSSESSEGSTGTGPAHILFTTSTAFTGVDVGGLRGADTICTAAGADVRRGDWVAVLADSNNPIESRISINGDVVNILGELLASDETELLSGQLQNIPGYDEAGVEVSPMALAWTGSMIDDCMGWTNDDVVVTGTTGLPSSTELWLDTTVPLPCSASPRLYCISQ